MRQTYNISCNKTGCAKTPLKLVPKKSHLRKQQADLIDDIPNDYSLNDAFIGLSELK